MSGWSERAAGVEAQRDALILEHIPLLKHLVGRMCFDVPGGMDRDDLYGIGMLGLIAAADSWEPERGLKFSTYAKIRGAILDELRKDDFLPRGRREKVRQLDAIVERLEHERGVPPSPEEVAEAMETSLEEVDEILLSATSASKVSLDDGISEGLSAMLSDPHCDDPVESAEFHEMRALLIEAIEELPEQDKTVITLYYGEELLLKEIGEVLDVTESRVSQIHSRAIYRLNRTFAALTGTAEQ
ncbi:MAG: FliA/WhiG family RNA polymerase sigma factor [Planctomycetota bacterium]|nr:FliA/WhiG family RNA polymerase sigma factor [Planctomycetota bacterium]